MAALFKRSAPALVKVANNKAVRKTIRKGLAKGGGKLAELATQKAISKLSEGPSPGLEADMER